MTYRTREWKEKRIKLLAQFIEEDSRKLAFDWDRAREIRLADYKEEYAKIKKELEIV